MSVNLTRMLNENQVYQLFRHRAAAKAGLDRFFILFELERQSVLSNLKHG